MEWKFGVDIRMLKHIFCDKLLGCDFMVYRLGMQNNIVSIFNHKYYSFSSSRFGLTKLNLS